MPMGSRRQLSGNKLSVAGDKVSIICLQAIAQQEEALWDEMLSAAGTIAEDARRRYKESQQVSFSKYSNCSHS